MVTSQKCDKTWIIWEIVAPIKSFIELTIHKFRPKATSIQYICLHDWWLYLVPYTPLQFLHLLVYNPSKHRYIFGSCGFGLPKRLLLNSPVIIEVQGKIFHRQQLQQKLWLFEMEFSYRIRTEIGKFIFKCAIKNCLHQ